jgi:hypothetical protein
MKISQRKNLTKPPVLWLISFLLFITGSVVLQSCNSGAGTSSPESPPTSASPPAGSNYNYPHLDWPPPKSSASTNVPSAALRKPQGEVTYLRDVDQKLRDVLDSNEYTRTSYFAVPNGFAIVTQLEHINADGTSRVADRWRAVDEVKSLGDFSLGNYLTALFRANPGYYRVIIFVVTSQPFTQSNESLSSEKAEAWLSEGLDRLPDPIANIKFTEEYKATALIYEFRKFESQKNAAISAPSKLSGRLHLERAKLWGSLVN